MQDKFAQLERPSFSTLSKAAWLLLFVAAFLGLTWSGAEPTRANGIIESVGSASYGRVHGGTQAAASVRLTDGTVVVASIVSGGPYASGDSIRLLKERRWLGGAVYQVVAKGSSQ
jgi:hypothetical protein